MTDAIPARGAVVAWPDGRTHRLAYGLTEGRNAAGEVYVRPLANLRGLHSRPEADLLLVADPESLRAVLEHLARAAIDSGSCAAPRLAAAIRT